MDARRLVVLVLLTLGAAVVGSALGESVSNLSDARSWQGLPWALLLVFWSIVGVSLWRKRQRRSS